MLVYLLLSAAGQSADELPRAALLRNKGDTATQLEHDVAVAALSGRVDGGAAGGVPEENATASTAPNWTTASLSASAWKKSFESARRRCRADCAAVSTESAQCVCLPGDASANLTEERSGERVTCKDKRVSGETFQMEMSFHTVTCDWFGEDPQLQPERCEKAGSMWSYAVRKDSAAPPARLRVADACCFCGGGSLTAEVAPPAEILPLIGVVRPWTAPEEDRPLPASMQVPALQDPKHLRFVAQHEAIRAKLASVYRLSGENVTLPNMSLLYPPKRPLDLHSPYPPPVEQPMKPRMPCSQVRGCKEFEGQHDDLQSRIAGIWVRNMSDRNVNVSRQLTGLMKKGR